MAKVFEDLCVSKKQNDAGLNEKVKKTIQTIKNAQRYYKFPTKKDYTCIYIFDNLRIIFNIINPDGLRVFDEKANGVMFCGHDFTDKKEGEKIWYDIICAVNSYETDKKKGNKGIVSPSLSGLYGVLELERRYKRIKRLAAILQAKLKSFL